MPRISRLTAADRAERTVLARSFRAFSNHETSDDKYAQTWRQLLAGNEIRPVVARLDGIARYPASARISLWPTTFAAVA